MQCIDDLPQSETDAIEAEQSFLASVVLPRPISELEVEWAALPFEEQMRISEEFHDQCIDGNCDPSAGYWYPMLMAETLKNYVGD